MPQKTAAREIDARATTEINRRIKELMAAGEKEIRVLNVQAQHNLAVGIIQAVSVLFEGSVGYYCGGLIDGPTIEVHGSAGWGLGESMLSGTLRVRGNAGNSCGAAIRGGTIVVHGNVAARAGVGMKGGLLIVEGDCGYMTGFMMQRGIVIVCGDGGAGLADSMYEGVIYVGGKIRDLGNDAIVLEPNSDDRKLLRENLSRWGISAERSFKKVVAGRKLWNFDKQEIGLWREAL